MSWLVAILGVVSVVANATMDELRFHWDRFFGKIAKPGTKLEQWMNPSISWVNKYKFKSRILTYLFSTLLVWFTDFWHLLKAIYLNTLFSIAVLLVFPDIRFLDLLMWLGCINLVWGLLFEMTFAFYGTMSDIINKK